MNKDLVLYSRMLRTALWIAACLFLCACAANTGRAPSHYIKEGSGASKADPEAERIYAEALDLWSQPLTSVRTGEVSVDPEKAVALLDQAIALEPAFTYAYARRGLARSELGQHEEAFDDLTTAIRLWPEAKLYAYRALALLRAGQQRAATRDIEYARKLDPTNTHVSNYRGLLAMTNGDASGACSSFKEGCSNGDCSFWDTARKEKFCP